MNTLPLWAMAEQLPLERLRDMIRKDPKLAALGQRFGTWRLYSPAEFRQIRAAYDAWLARRSKKAVPANV